MAVRVTARPRYGPVRVNMGRRGVSSVTVRLGPVSWRLWSRTARPGLSSVDLPGPLSWRPSAGRLTAAGRAARRVRIARRWAVLSVLALAVTAAVVTEYGPDRRTVLALVGVVAATVGRYLLARRAVRAAGARGSVSPR